MRDRSVEVSIIIPNFNTKKLCSDCIGSIYKFTKNISFEIIVVDNGSTDGSYLYLKKNFPQIILVKNKQNLGYGRASNMGAKRAIGKYLCILNSDTLFTTNILPSVVKRIKKDNKIGILSPKLIDQSGHLQTSGGSFPTLTNLLAWTFFIDDIPMFKRYFPAYHQTDNSLYQKERRFEWLQGAFFLIKKKVFVKVSGFDPKIFMYAEDIDLSYRLVKKDYINLYYPGAKLIHLSKKKISLNTIIGEYQGLLYFLAKHYGPKHKSFAKKLLIINAYVRILVFGILLSDENKKQVYQQACRKLSQL